jgi:ubiquitin carboxyl-terminal hydrolase 47
MINDLYEGIIIDFVKCLKCGNESRREDKFLDLSLTVRSEFENVQNDSVEKALESYTKTDRLDGDNQYACEVCEEKTDALKGMKFLKFPYILALQLKRFDLDFTTM